MPPINNFFTLKKGSEGSNVVPLWGTGFDSRVERGNRYLGGEESEYSIIEKGGSRNVEMQESPREVKKRKEREKKTHSRNKQIEVAKSVTSNRRDKLERSHRTPQGNSWERRPKLIGGRNSLGREEETSREGGQEKQKVISLKRDSRSLASRGSWFHRPDCSATRVKMLRRVYNRYFQNGGQSSWTLRREGVEGSRLNLTDYKNAREEREHRWKRRGIAVTAAEYIRKFEAIETKIFT